jgi:hypothetical protein
MQTITLTTYTFDELDEEAQERALADHAAINVDHDWWDFTIDDFHAFGDASGLGCTYGRGFDLDRASYVCLAHFATTLAALEAGRARASAEYPNYAKEVLEPFFAAFTPNEWRQLRRLERWQQLGALSGWSETQYRSYPIRSEIETWASAAYPRVHRLLDHLETAWETCVQDLEHALLHALRQEAEYLTSAEAIRDTLVANAYHFTEDGVMHN